MARLAVFLGLAAALCMPGQTAGTSDPYSRYLQWRENDGRSKLSWDESIAQYRLVLAKQGLAAAQVDKTISIISSRDEAALYDPVYQAPAKFDTAPSKLLTEAIRNRKPGKALDVGMGQGRNAILLAQRGWQVTGFDVSKAGLAEAQKLAAKANVAIETVLAADEEFDFGTDRWDLIAILYPIEKRSVFRVRQALRKGGIVVVECGHKEAGRAPFEYETNELLQIFEGFRILKYEDTVAIHDWTRKEMRMVRMIAEK